MTQLIDLSKKLRTGKISSRELCLSYFTEIEKKNPDLSAFITVTKNEAFSAADAVDQARAKGERLPLLAGIPTALKDNLCTKGISTTCASRMLQHFVPPYDATVVSLLKQAGTPILGKLNMDEFAMGGTTETSFFGACKNPLNPKFTPGGSSGGSAAAVAAGLVPFSLGTDTGGSIRQPAAFCGLTGLKPTYGLVSRYGLIAYASSMDTIGPICRTVDDCALVLSAITGQDPKDATSLSHPKEDYRRLLNNNIHGLRIAILNDHSSVSSSSVQAATKQAALQLHSFGADVEEVSFPLFSSALAAYYTLASAEASSNLSRYDGVKYGFRAESSFSPDELFCRSRSEGFGHEVKRRILLGTFVLSAGFYEAYYERALIIRKHLQADYTDLFSRYDCLLSPVTPDAAFEAGTADLSSLYYTDYYTVPASLAGLPALSIPFGKTKDGRALAVQLTGPAFSEAKLLQIASALEGGVTNI